MYRRDERQGLEILFSKSSRGGFRGAVDVQVGLLLKPPPRGRPQVFQVLKLPAAKEVAFYVFKRRLDLPLRLGPAGRHAMGLQL